MSSRMTKYYEEPELMSRAEKNKELYKDISKNELENYSIKSNATVLGDNNNEIDVEKIKKILDTKYKELPKRKTIKIEEEPEVVIEKEDTKEYDIKAILEKAKEEKNVSYEEERLKKLHDTQFKILKDIYPKSDFEGEIEENVPKKTGKNINSIEDLINTITFNEKQNSSSEPDLFDDLLKTGIYKSDQNKLPEVELEKTDENQYINTDEITASIEIDSVNKKNEDDTFYTKSNAIESRDFEDVEEGMGLIPKIIITIVILAFLVGVVLILHPILIK